ncbi:MAG: hypothetical protein OHK0052_12730 [Anaerolineales bacterium]
MEIVINAVYEQGRLRLLSPLALPENTRVRVTVKTVEPPPDDPDEHRRRVERVLVEAGLALPRQTFAQSTGLLTDERRAELAQMFSSDQPLSVLISEEREER